MRHKSPDTDIFFKLFHYVQELGDTTVLFDTGKGNQKRLIEISSLAKGLTQNYCTALLALHAFTGADTTSAFKSKGKLKPMTLLKGNHSFIETYASF